MSNFFSMSGRSGRQQYFVTSLIIVLITYACAFAIGFVSGVSGKSVENAGALGGVVGLVGCIAQAFVTVRRFHDLGKPGWHYWLLLIPLYNIYLGLVLLFTKGASGNNQYGPDPTAA